MVKVMVNTIFLFSFENIRKMEKTTNTVDYCIITKNMRTLLRKPVTVQIISGGGGGGGAVTLSTHTHARTHTLSMSINENFNHQPHDNNIFLFRIRVNINKIRDP